MKDFKKEIPKSLSNKSESQEKVPFLPLLIIEVVSLYGGLPILIRNLLSSILYLDLLTFSRELVTNNFLLSFILKSRFIFSIAFSSISAHRKFLSAL